MNCKLKVRMNVSIAGETWSLQPGHVVVIDSALAQKWIRSGHAERTNEPLTTQRDLLGDLTAAEALTHLCVSCERRRAQIVFRNRPLCLRCGKAEMEA